MTYLVWHLDVRRLVTTGRKSAPSPPKPYPTKMRAPSDHQCSTLVRYDTLSNEVGMDHVLRITGDSNRQRCAGHCGGIFEFAPCAATNADSRGLMGQARFIRSTGSQVSNHGLQWALSGKNRGDFPTARRRRPLDVSVHGMRGRTERRPGDGSHLSKRDAERGPRLSGRNYSRSARRLYLQRLYGT